MAERVLSACAQAGGLTPPKDIVPHLPWTIAAARKAGLRYSGRVFSEQELRMLSAMVEQEPCGGRTAISRRACELLQWYTPDGRLKEGSMRTALLKMEAEGRFVLPPRRTGIRGPNKPIPRTARTAAREDLFTPAGRIPDLKLELAEDRNRQALWNEYIDRYHYLGYATPAGAYLKYFACSADQELALLGFSSAAWKIAPRDAYIGWNDRQRQEHLPLVVNNSRFLILPWVCSRNLASKLLAMAAARLADDWHRRWGYRPVLLESFVETERFTGSCYRAANWRHVGTTTGRGRNDIDKRAALPTKEIFLYPLLLNTATAKAYRKRTS